LKGLQRSGFSQLSVILGLSVGMSNVP
jgi:hypothetical protein